jgi:hypothetical protein
MPDPDLTSPVVVVREYGGVTQVGWYTDLATAAYPAKAVLTATAAGVVVAGYLTDVPPGWVDAARRAHDVLKADPGADMGRLATHAPVGPSNGPLRTVAGKAG